VFAASLLCATQLVAQQDSADVLVLTHSFVAGSREFVRVFLQKGQVYRAEINLGQVGFTIRPRHPGGDTPTLARVRGGLGASRESVWEIYPFKDDEYEVQVSDFPEGEAATLNIYRDIVASQRRQGIATKPGTHWFLGIEAGIASHGSYRISVFEVDPDRSGTDFEGCLTLRPSGGSFWGCLIGATNHSGTNAEDVLWLYVEPRFAVVRGGTLRRPELGILLRGGFGSSQEAGANPAELGFGAYLRVWPSPIAGKGISIGASLLYHKLLGVQDLNESYTSGGMSIGVAF
jgi:hypothetical protein